MRLRLVVVLLKNGDPKRPALIAIKLVGYPEHHRLAGTIPTLLELGKRLGLKNGLAVLIEGRGGRGLAFVVRLESIEEPVPGL